MGQHLWMSTNHIVIHSYSPVAVFLLVVMCLLALLLIRQTFVKQSRTFYQAEFHSVGSSGSLPYQSSVPVLPLYRLSENTDRLLERRWQKIHHSVPLHPARVRNCRSSGLAVRLGI